MTRILQNFLIRVRNLIVHEFPVLLGVAFAAAAAASATPVLIIPAVGAALLRFVVSPAFQQAATKEKVLDPKLISQVEQYLKLRDAVAKQVVNEAVSAAPSAVQSSAGTSVVQPTDGETFTPAP